MALGVGMRRRHEFGAALRDARNRAGWSQAALAKAVHYSPGQVSKIKNGLKAASIELARRCDALLGTGGELERLIAARPRSDAHDHNQPVSGDWILRLSADGSLAWTAGPLATGSTSGYESTPRVDLNLLSGSLDATRRYAHGVPPAAMISILIGPLHAMRGLA
jgi:transcriptional regulator with XRE-family HTH domain